MADKPNVECPHCHSGLHISAASVVDNEQRMTWSVHPKDGDMLQAKTVGGTLARIDELLRLCAKEDGGNVRCYVERAHTDETGAVHFDLAILPVTKAKPTPQAAEHPAPAEPTTVTQNTVVGSPQSEGQNA